MSLSIVPESISLGTSVTITRNETPKEPDPTKRVENLIQVHENKSKGVEDEEEVEKKTVKKKMVMSKGKPVAPKKAAAPPKKDESNAIYQLLSKMNSKLDEVKDEVREVKAKVN